MPRLLLIRHAKAAWAAPGMTDFDRPLTTGGMRAARAAGAALAQAGESPGLVLCSPALRTRQTWEGVAQFLGPHVPVRYERALYDSDAQTYIDILRTTGAEPETVLLVGHNPMAEDVGDALSGGGDAAALDAMRAGFPVCGLATIDFDMPFAEIRPGAGTLRRFTVFGD